MVNDHVEVSIREVGSRENGSWTATRINQIASTPVAAAELYYGRPTTSFTGRLAKLLFFVHLLAIAILIAFLSIRGFLARNPAFHPAHWYTPLLTSAGSSSIAALLWLLFVLHHPSKAIKAALWLSPMLSCGVAVLLLADEIGSSLAFAVPALLLALVQSLYGCWVTRRLHHACEILSASIAAVQPSLAVATYVSLVLLAGLVFFSFWTLGAGGVAADGDSRLTPVYLLLLLLSLGWTMQVLRYVVHVAVAQLAYMRLACGMEAAAAATFKAAAGLALGDVCYGSAVVPAVVVVRGVARAMGVVAGGSDEFLFSCANCYTGVADHLVARANRWGFVYAGVYGRGLGSASAEVWEMFAKRGMRRLIDLDLTGSFCFFCGVAVGGASALVAGSWAMAVDKGHVTEVTVYAFIIGYFMARIAMAWPQACVAAYHVVFAENPQSHSCIAARMRELQTSSPD